MKFLLKKWQETTIDPLEGVVVSSFNGTVKQVIFSRHALVVESEEGLPVLIHIGLDTVNLKGEGFEVLVNEGQVVRRFTCKI